MGIVVTVTPFTLAGAPPATAEQVRAALDVCRPTVRLKSLG
jgi:hypothetical protein